MLDNLCDTCHKPMDIKRNAKNSRFLSCVNPDCGRSRRKKGSDAPQANAPVIPPAAIPKRSGFARIGF
jgi:ssDNA-binding Zn-finger/Zn-ribbon topoisomerase 1